MTGVVTKAGVPYDSVKVELGSQLTALKWTYTDAEGRYSISEWFSSGNCGGVYVSFTKVRQGIHNEGSPHYQVTSCGTHTIDHEFPGLTPGGR